MPQDRRRRTLAAAAAAALMTIAAAAPAQLVPPPPKTPRGPLLPRAATPPDRPPPAQPDPVPSITARDGQGRVILLDTAAEAAAARALELTDAERGRLPGAIARYHAEVDRLVVDHLELVLNTLLPARARADMSGVDELRSALSAAATLERPSLLPRLEREGILTPQQRQHAKAALDDHARLAAEDAALAATDDGPEAVAAARLRVEFLLATGELAASAHRLFIAAADRWQLIEPDLKLDPGERTTLARAVLPALDDDAPVPLRAAAMARALSRLNIEIAAAALRAGSPASFVPEPPPHQPSTPLALPD